MSLTTVLLGTTLTQMIKAQKQLLYQRYYLPKRNHLIGSEYHTHFFYVKAGYSISQNYVDFANLLSEKRILSTVFPPLIFLVHLEGQLLRILTTPSTVAVSPHSKQDGVMYFESFLFEINWDLTCYSRDHKNISFNTKIPCTGCFSIL